MPNTRYRRGQHYAADMAVYSRQMAGDNSRELSRLKRNLIRALQEDVTEKQRTALLLYYAEGYNMREIGEKLGVDKSTISRTIKRGAAAPALPALRGGGLPAQYAIKQKHGRFRGRVFHSMGPKVSKGKMEKNALPST